MSYEHSWLCFIETEYEDLPAYYAAADVFVSASTNEPVGMTYVEALACGCPVMAARNPISERLINDDDVAEGGEEVHKIIFSGKKNIKWGPPHYPFEFES